MCTRAHSHTQTAAILTHAREQQQWRRANATALLQWKLACERRSWRGLIAYLEQRRWKRRRKQAAADWHR
jgi:hypothetical protein